MHLLNIQRIARRRKSRCISDEAMVKYLDESVKSTDVELHCREAHAEERI
jgi:hypothetical protein